MDILPPPSSTTPRPASLTGNAAASSDPQASSATRSERPVSSDFETFLVMLTAQIENQDPLNPIDSTDYAVQLATFSGVEQQVLTNELLQTMVPGGEGLGTLTELAGWIGMEARVAGRAPLSGAGVDLSFAMPPEMTTGAVEIVNASGATLASLPVARGETSVFWDGRTASGARLPDGSYNVSLTGRDAEGGPVSGEVHAFVRVSEARMAAGGGELRLADDRIIAPEAVSALREAT